MFLVPMTIMPEQCTISYECTSIDEDGEASSSISCDDLVTYIDTDTLFSLESLTTKYGSPYRPGTYTVTITGTIDGVADVVPGTNSKTTTFDFTLTDPCLTAVVTVVEADLVDQEYTISDVSQTYTLSPIYSVEPDFCRLEVTAVWDDTAVDVLTFDDST